MKTQELMNAEPREVEITGRYIYISVEEFSYKSGKWGNSLSLFGSMVT